MILFWVALVILAVVGSPAHQCLARYNTRVNDLKPYIEYQREELRVRAVLIQNLYRALSSFNQSVSTSWKNYARNARSEILEKINWNIEFLNGKKDDLNTDHSVLSKKLPSICLLV